MSKYFRVLFRLLIFILFILIAVFSLLFSKGFRFDPEEGELISTGVLDISSLPKEAGIFIDDEFVGFTPDFFNGVHIKPTKIHLEKGGFLPWEKVIDIDSFNVSKVKPLLIPEDLDYFVEVIGHEDEIFYKEKNNYIYRYFADFDIYYFLNLQTGQESLLDSIGQVNQDPLYYINHNSKEFTSKENLISPDEKSLLVIHDTTLRKLDLKTNKSVLVKDFGEKVNNAFWINGSDTLLVMLAGSIMAIDSDGQNLMTIFKKDYDSPVFFIGEDLILIWQYDDVWQRCQFSRFYK